MRLIALCLLLCGGCTSAANTYAPPAAAPVPPKGSMSTAQAYNYCKSEAFRQCGAATVRCEAYRQSFTEGCLVNLGVPAVVAVH